MRKNRRKYLYLLLGFIALGLIVARLILWQSDGRSSNETIKVVRMDLAQEVTITGRVKTSENLSLAFTKSGKIVSVSAVVGSRVSPGVILAGLDQADILAQIDQAAANTRVEEAKLQNLKNGTRSEEIAVQEATVQSAKTAQGDAASGLRDKINSTFITADDAVHTKADQMFSNPRSANPQLAFNADSQTTSDVAGRRSALEKVFSDWSGLLPTASDQNNDLLRKADVEKGHLALIAAFLDKLSLALNQVTQTGSVNNTTLATWKTDVSSARVNIQTAVSALSTAEEKLRTADSTYEVESRTLALDRAGTPAAEIAAEEGVVENAKAKEAGLQSTLSDTIMRSPTYGIISRVDAKVGEIATANETLIRVVSTAAYDIEANIPETDIGTVSLGNVVRITLDAFSGETFEGKVVLIDPAETMVDGAVNFKTMIRFNQPDRRVKSGMTANLRIQTVLKKWALALPQHAVLENDRGKFVRLANAPSNATDTPITTGIRTPDGFIEILSGVGEGETVENIGIKEK